MITTAEIFECNSPEYMQIILGFLGCTVEEIAIGYEIFKDAPEFDEEEMWCIPKGIEILLQIDHLHCPTFTWGHVTLASYKGAKVVIEQNASPLMLYWKSK